MTCKQSKNSNNVHNYNCLGFKGEGKRKRKEKGCFLKIVIVTILLCMQLISAGAESIYAETRTY